MNGNNDKFIQFFKALANEERIQILRLLKKNKEMCAQDVEKNFYLEQSTTSHHLNTLRRAGITKARKSGRNVFYSIDYDSFKEIWDQFSTSMF
ncbi:helix-turn-helix transcriptional regulator [bacterium]|jgi:ArsR family transcriptional regulator, arsenate/arsenite/antimonite-responsive transcriptional repressor|nr:helix-turn-helix transcriptional regulator [bacterium]